jgi:hypothetical protein
MCVDANDQGSTTLGFNLAHSTVPSFDSAAVTLVNNAAELLSLVLPYGKVELLNSGGGAYGEKHVIVPEPKVPAE